MSIKTILLVCALIVSPTAFASDDFPFYGEVYLNEYRGGDSYMSQEAYLEYAFTDTLAVWANGYHDEFGNIFYAGLSKTWDSGWTIALGAGQARDGKGLAGAFPDVGLGGRPHFGDECRGPRPSVVAGARHAGAAQRRGRDG